MEQGLPVPQMAARVREREAPGLRGLTRSLADGRDGVQAAPRPGWPAALTEASRLARLAAVRRRPRRVGGPCSLWTLPRLGDAHAEPTRMRVAEATVRRALQPAGLGLSRPQPQRRRPAPASARTKRRWPRPAPS